MILVAVLVGLGLATLAVLVITALSLAKQGARLASSVAAFQKEIRPILEEIRSDADRMSGRLEELRPRHPRVSPDPAAVGYGMPSLGFGEIIVIVLIALIVFGPKRLPEIGRTVGKSMREFRRATSEFRADLESGLDAEPPTVPPPSARRASAPDAEPGSERGGPEQGGRNFD